MRWLLSLQHTGPRYAGFIVAALGPSGTGSVVVAHRLSCPAAVGSSGPGMKPVSPALAGGLLSRGKSSVVTFEILFQNYKMPLQLSRVTQDRGGSLIGNPTTPVEPRL